MMDMELKPILMALSRSGFGVYPEYVIFGNYLGASKMKSVQLKKIAISTLAVAALFSAVSPAAQAATAVSGNFNLVINLTSACTVTTPGAITLAYNGLQTTAVSGSSAFNIQCTNTLPYTMATDVTGATAAVTGLAYTLATSAAGGTGNGAAQAYTVVAGIAANQAGTCATATCTDTSVHTLTVTY